MVLIRARSHERTDGVEEVELVLEGDQLGAIRRDRQEVLRREDQRLGDMCRLLCRGVWAVWGGGTNLEGSEQVLRVGIHLRLLVANERHEERGDLIPHRLVLISQTAVYAEKTDYR